MSLFPRTLSRNPKKTEKTERFRKEIVLLFSKNHELLKLLRLVIWRRLTNQQFDCVVLLLCDYQHPHRSRGRQSQLDSSSVGFHRITPVTHPCINRILYHMVPVLYKELTKLRGASALCFCFDWQIKHHQYSHKPIHIGAAPAESGAAIPVLHLHPRWSLLMPPRRDRWRS